MGADLGGASDQVATDRNFRRLGERRARSSRSGCSPGRNVLACCSSGASADISDDAYSRLMSTTKAADFRATAGRDQVLAGSGQLIETTVVRSGGAPGDTSRMVDHQWRIEVADHELSGVATGQVMIVEVDDGRRATAVASGAGVLTGISTLV